MIRLQALPLVTLAVMTAACASSGSVPRPFPTPGVRPPSEAPPTPEGTTPPPPLPGATPLRPTAKPAFDAYALTGTALMLRGTPYRNGGTDPNGFDCSGFTQYVFGQYGVALPREVRDQFDMGKAVKPEEIAAGDLVFFTTVSPGASHVGISLGGDEFVHAPSSTGVVRVERASSPYWSSRFIAARRISS